MNNGSSSTSYSYPSKTASYGGYHGGGDAAGTASVRRRNLEHVSSSNRGAAGPSPTSSNNNVMIKKLDFMFPKVDSEYTVKTESGGVASVVAIVLVFILVLAECHSWKQSNYNATREFLRVDTSLSKRMRVNLNITFPSLACEDLHVDVMDVAGDSQLNVEETMLKRRLNKFGLPIGAAQVVESNQNQASDKKKNEILKQAEALPEDYCGPCFGASDETHNITCCNTCDELIDAYKNKKWRTDVITMTSEQCIREGRDDNEPKLMKKGEGCNLSGSMTLGRVSGNFHIAMGEGVERDGRHIHAFVPEDTPNFNASHIIHHLSFGSPEETWAESSLDGATKIVTKELGTTGLFQYFIKVVPTTYLQQDLTRKETNRYFVTERFRPLMRELVEDDDAEVDDDDEAGDGNNKKNKMNKKDNKGRKVADVHYRGGNHANAKHHDVKNSILPGVFFIYEIYPFAVEVTPTSVPLTHLLIRIMATVGGVFTIVKWADSFLFRALNKGRRGHMMLND